MKSEITGYKVEVEITIEQFETLDDLHHRDVIDVFDRLERLGAYNIKWNGHFGPYIFYDIDNKDDIGNIEREINAMINLKE